MPDFTKVSRDGSIIHVAGRVALATYKRVLATVHTAVDRAGYQEITLDMSECGRANPAPMLALCAQIQALRQGGISTHLILPKNPTLRRLFQNANWANLIDPRNYDPSLFRGTTQLPATPFSSAPEQQSIVNAISKALLASTEGLERSQFQAFDWSINEVTDNVLVHAKSRVGGLVQVSTFDPIKKIIEFDVCDPGIGIPTSLRVGHPELTSDAEALDRAIREGVTSDPTFGQGNGLFGTYQVCAISKGAFQIHSGYANLTYSDKNGLHVYGEQIPFSGTLVVGRISFGEKGVLEDALKFGGKVHIPVDLIDTHYESDRTNQLVFTLCRETSSCGSRIAGIPVRGRLKNLLDMMPRSKITVDFIDVPIMSSSFADEVFGKLFVEVGPLTFMHRIQFINVPTVVRNLIDKAIVQRVNAGSASQ